MQAVVLTFVGSSSNVNICVILTETFAQSCEHLTSLANNILVLAEEHFDNECHEPGCTTQQSTDEHNRTVSHSKGARNSRTHEYEELKQR